MKTCCDIWGAFDEKNNLVKDYKHWKLLVRNRNTTLGNCVAITKRHMLRFSETTPEEFLDFHNIVKDVEKSLKSAFDYDKINYLMLMGKDLHAHFHIIPRYASPRTFAGKTWTDELYPKPDASAKETVPQETLNKIKNEIKKHLTL